MSKLSKRKKAVLTTFALGTVLVPLIYGASAQVAEDLRPMVRIAPVYPAAAVEASREGAVQLQFTINPDGTTKDIIVLESSSPEFEAPAVAALEGWRYMRQPEERRGVRTVINFQLGSANPQAEAD